MPWGQPDSCRHSAGMACPLGEPRSAERWLLGSRGLPFQALLSPAPHKALATCFAVGWALAGLARGSQPGRGQERSLTLGTGTRSTTASPNLHLPPRLPAGDIQASHPTKRRLCLPCPCPRDTCFQNKLGRLLWPLLSPWLPLQLINHRQLDSDHFLMFYLKIF